MMIRPYGGKSVGANHHSPSDGAISDALRHRK
jgi:hypothetical protein